MALEDKARGQRIAQLRKRRRLTQQAMAERLRIGYRTYQTWEGGTMPEFANLEKLANFFGVKPEYLIGDEGVFPDAVSQLDRIEKLLQSVTPAATPALRDDPRDAHELAAMHARLDDLQEAVDRIEGYLRDQASAAVRERVSRAARQQSKRRDTRRADPAAEDG